MAHGRVRSPALDHSFARLSNVWWGVADEQPESRETRRELQMGAEKWWILPTTWKQVRALKEAIAAAYRAQGDKFACAGETGYEAFCLALSGDRAVPAYTYRGDGYVVRAALVNCLLGVAPQAAPVVENWDAELHAIGMEPIPAPAPVPAPAPTAAAKAARLARLRAGFAATVSAHGVVMVEPAMPVYVRLLPDGEETDVAVHWPDERGPQPAIGTRVKVSPRGEIEIEESKCSSWH